MKKDSGTGLMLIEMRAGITLESKLKKICPHFARMHALYGERANVNPPCTGGARLPGPELYIQQSDDEDGLPVVDQPIGMTAFVDELDCLLHSFFRICSFQMSQLSGIVVLSKRVKPKMGNYGRKGASMVLYGWETSKFHPCI